jgi:hypothetical protein
MLIRSCLVSFILFGSVFLAGGAWGATSAIEGVVKDPSGHPISGADIRVEAKDGGSGSKTVKTDAKGHYIYTGLPAGGTYRVSLVINSAVKASINNVKTKLGDPTQLNFDLKPTKASQDSASTKKAKHFVWVPAETGTHIGGRWVEVDEAGNSSTAGADHVQKAGGTALKRMQDNGGVVRGGN